jgi:two-component system LytT family sensor kinase
MSSSVETTVLHPALRFIRYVGLWTAVGVFFFTQDVAQSLDAREPVRWPRVLECYLLRAYVWALLAPIVVRFARRLRVPNRYSAGWIAIHCALGAATAFVAAGVTACIGSVLGIPWYLPDLRTAVPQALVSGFHSGLFTYWIIVGACEVFDNFRNSQQAQIESARLKAQLVQAQLQVLKNQLHPHFLFNALNAIVALIRRRRNDQAEALTGRLGELLRNAMDVTGIQQVPLSRELQFLQAYLDIERIRYGERLRIDLQIDSEAHGVLVPYMCLQPLAENAIRHGIACRSGPGTLTVSACIRGTSLEVTIADDGVGCDPIRAGAAQGIGIANTRARLGHLYGPSAHLHIESSPGRGTLVSLSVPLTPRKVAELEQPLQTVAYARRR